jgi:PKD repeat protein
MKRTSALAAVTAAVLSSVVAPAARATPPAPVLGQWGPPIPFAAPSGSSMSAQTSMGPRGDVVAVYADYVDSTHRTLLAQSHLAGDSPWMVETTLSDSSRVVGQHVVTTGADGAAVAVWGENTPVPMVGMPGMYMSGPNRIYTASMAADGTWSAEAPLSSGAHGAQYATVAIDDAGRAVALWSENGEVHAAIRAADGTWGADQRIDTAATGGVDLRVVARPDGSFVAVWSDGNGALSYNVLDGSTWGTAAAISVSGYANSPSIDVDGDGVVTLAYQVAHTEIVRTFSVAGTWSAATQLSIDGGLNYYEPTLDVAPDGRAIVGWPQIDSSSYEKMVSIRGTDGTWSAPTDLGAGGSDSFGVAIGDGGKATAAWQSASGGHVVARVFDGTSWATATDVSGGPGNFVTLAGDDHGNVIASYLANGGAATFATLDRSGPDLRTIAVPGTGTAGAAVAVSVSPVDAFSALGTTTWDFGDGTSTATGDSASHTYGAAGTYAVTATATDALGQSSTATRTIVVGAGTPGGGNTDNTDDTPDVTVHNTTTTPPAATPAPAAKPAPAPAPAPAPSASPEAPRVQLAHTQKIGTLLARQAIRTSVTAGATGTVTVRATVDAKTAAKLGLRSKTLAKITVKAKGSAATTVQLKLSAAVRKKLAKLPSLKVTITTTYTDADGQTHTSTDTLTSKR